MDVMSGGHSVQKGGVKGRLVVLSCSLCRCGIPILAVWFPSIEL